MPKLVPGLGRARHPTGALRELLAAAAGQPPGRSVQHIDRPSADRAADTLVHDPNRQIREAVVIKVPSGQRRPELVAVFGRPGHPRAVLAEQLAAGPGQPTRRPVQDVDRPSAPYRPDVLEHRPDGQVDEAVVVESACRLPTACAAATWPAKAIVADHPTAAPASISANSNRRIPAPPGRAAPLRTWLSHRTTPSVEADQGIGNMHVRCVS